MKGGLLIILSVLCGSLFVSIIGCSDPRVETALRRASELIEEYPDSARVVLDSIDSLHLRKGNAALYAVLDAQSRHKLYMSPPASDSLLNIAVDRYSSHGPDSMLMKAFFYRAIKHQGEMDLENATHDAICSWEVAKSLKNSYWEAKDAELLADMAAIIQNYQEELKWRRIAADSYKKAGKTENYLYALCDVSSSYLNLRDSINACCLDDSIQNILPKYKENVNLQLYHANSSIYIQNTYGRINYA
ncbi:MAG: hypothetical protein K2G23_07755, partial [Muribaculaceae bacterium]|nr:hypothetical protein [Muribaculaceae bacterium]